MKKNLSLAGYSLVAMGLLMGSCVSKRKYMDAQTSAAQRYSTDSTQWANRATTMQQNVSSLEQRNTTYQKQVDSFATATTAYEKRWEPFQTTYTTQNTSTEQLHQKIHAAIDDLVEANNVENKNGKIYVNLPESMLFTSGSSTLTKKGKDALDKLAVVLAENDNVEVDIITTAAYYSDGTSNASMTDNQNANASATDNSANRNSDATTSANANRDAAKADNANPSTANVGDSGFTRSGAVTKKPVSTAKKSTASRTSTAKKTTSTAAKKSSSDRSMTFKSTPKKATAKSKAPSWNLNVARSSAIVRQLTETGLPKARIVLTGPKSKAVTTNDWANSNRGYQVVVSPKLDPYYQMMQEGQANATPK